MRPMMNLQAAALAVGGHLLDDASAAQEFTAVSSDSRTLPPGALFVALDGENFAGHRFLAAARDAGAAAALVGESALAEITASGSQAPLPLIVAADSRLALGSLAAAWRSYLPMPLIAVTGSNGKTTTKEMIGAILRAAYGDAVLVSGGNFNNDIGLPLTLLQMQPSHRAAVVELGMNHPGEIAYLAQIARPDVAVITNAQRAHLAGLGSLGSIALEKGSIFSSLGATGTAVINLDDPHAPLWLEKAAHCRRLGFALSAAAEVHGRVNLRGLDSELHFMTPDGEGAVDLALPGLHNARNALAAIAACHAAGIGLEAITRGLGSFKGIKGRLQRRAGVNGALILDDTYNANPDSICAGIDVLAATLGRKILVLGDMGEIGEAAAQYHDEVGGYAKSAGIDALYTLGETSRIAAHNFGDGAQHYKKPDELLAALQSELGAGCTVLVKGSRFMRMERIADAIAIREEEAPCS